MTEKEKAKAYDKAIERAKKLYGNGVTEDIFPELKEDDTERIRKNCIHFLELQKQHHAATFEIEECIDWLKKQRKSKSYWKPTEEQYEALDYAYNSCSDTERGNYYEGVLETLIEYLHLLEKQDKSPWISVKDYLPKQDDEVIVLCDELNTAPSYKISFGHIVDKTICKDYNGWNIPNVAYWFPMPKLPKE